MSNRKRKQPASPSQLASCKGKKQALRQQLSFKEEREEILSSTRLPNDLISCIVDYNHSFITLEDSWSRIHEHCPSLRTDDRKIHVDYRNSNEIKKAWNLPLLHQHYQIHYLGYLGQTKKDWCQFGWELTILSRGHFREDADSVPNPQTFGELIYALRQLRLCFSFPLDAVIMVMSLHFFAPLDALLEARKERIAYWDLDFLFNTNKEKLVNELEEIGLYFVNGLGNYSEDTQIYYSLCNVLSAFKRCSVNGFVRFLRAFGEKGFAQTGKAAREFLKRTF